VVERVHYPNFDSLRLFLALEVMVQHIYLHVYGWDTPVVRVPIAPVPVFLALSGFLVLKSMESSRSMWHFWQKRACRILPVFFVALGVATILFGLDGLRGSLVSYVTFGYVSGRPNGPLWSLSTEEVAYVLMALLTVVGFYKRPWLILLSAIISVILTGYLTKPLGVEFLKWANLVPAFLVGSYCYKAKLKAPWWLGWLILIIVASTVTLEMRGVGGYRVSVTIFLASLGAILAATSSKPLPFKPKIDLSYAIYAYHMPIAWWFAAKGIGEWMWLAVPASAFSLAIASHYLVEKPALKLKDWRPGSSSKSVPEQAPSPAIS
jgi:peptidoglycan/LPS O-acetylase OafA/YrhL